MSPEKYGNILSKYGFQVKRVTDTDSTAPQHQPPCNRTPEPTNRRIDHHQTAVSHPTFLHPCDAYASTGDTPRENPANTGLGVGCPAKQSPNPKIARITKA